MAELSPEFVTLRGKLYVQTEEPTLGEGVAVGAVWSDSDGADLLRCTSISPVTFVSTEGGATFGAPTGNIDIGDAQVEGTSGNATRADHQHVFTAPSTGYPVDTDFAAEADGTATTPARSDHRHTLGTPAAPTGDVDIGDAAATGSGGQPSREDHQHAFPAPSTGYPVDTDFTAEADGSATTPARSDHRHTLGTPAAPTGDVDIGDAAAVGSGGQPAREDHQHAFPAPGAGYPLDVSSTEADGSATTSARSDHVHAVPSTLATSHDIEAWISAAAMKGTGTAGAGDADKLPESRELATNDVNIDFMAFDTSTAEHAFFQWAVPTGWDEGTITFVLYWTAASGSGTIDFDLKALAFGNSDALDAAFGTAQNVSDTLLTADDVHISPESSAITIGGTPAEGDIVMFDLSRDTATDTLGVDCQVLGVKITYTRNSYTD